MWKFLGCMGMWCKWVMATCQRQVLVVDFDSRKAWELTWKLGMDSGQKKWNWQGAGDRAGGDALHAAADVPCTLHLNVWIRVQIRLGWMEAAVNGGERLISSAMVFKLFFDEMSSGFQQNFMPLLEITFA